MKYVVNKLKHCWFFVLLLIIYNSFSVAYCQGDADLDEPTWAFRSVEYIVYQPNSANDQQFGINFMQPRKQYATEIGRTLGSLLLVGAYNGHIETYSFPERLLLSPEEAKKIGSLIDEIKAIDPVTLKSYTETIIHSPPHEKVRIVKVMLDWYFDVNNYSFYSRVIALNPVLEYSEKDYTGLKPMFWTFLENEELQYNYMRPDVPLSDTSWAFRSYIDLNILSDNVNPDILYQYEFSNEKHFVKPLLEAVKAREIEVFPALNKEPLNKSEVDYIFSGVDSVWIVDPVTLEERLEVVNHELETEIIHQLRILKDWFYDAEKHRLETRVIAIAPIVHHKKSENYGAHNSIPFWIKFDNDRLRPVVY